MNLRDWIIILLLLATLFLTNRCSYEAGWKAGEFNCEYETYYEAKDI